MTLPHRTSLDDVNSACAPSAAGQRRRLDTERANGQFDPMPVADRGLTNDLGLGLLANLPSEVRHAFDSEVTPMGAVGQIQRKERLSVRMHQLSPPTFPIFASPRTSPL